MRQQEWPEEWVNMVCNFWIAFETHTWRHDLSEYHKRALLLYQGRVCRDWHKTLGTLAAVCLLPLNEDHLNELHQELLDNVYMAKIDAVPMVHALPHHFPTAQTNDYVFSFPSLRSSLFPPFSPPSVLSPHVLKNRVEADTDWEWILAVDLD